MRLHSNLLTIEFLTYCWFMTLICQRNEFTLLENSFLWYGWFSSRNRTHKTQKGAVSNHRPETIYDKVFYLFNTSKYTLCLSG